MSNWLHAELTKLACLGSIAHAGLVWFLQNRCDDPDYSTTNWFLSFEINIALKTLNYLCVAFNP